MTTDKLLYTPYQVLDTIKETQTIMRRRIDVRNKLSEEVEL